MSAQSTSTGGAGFLTLLTLLFIGLKLTGYIQWSWFWVLSPLLLPIIVVFVIAIIALLIYLISR